MIKATSSTLSSQQPTISGHVNTFSVLNAAAHAQGDLAKFGLKQILPLLEKRPKDVGLAMLIIQLYVLTNNHGSAITVLNSLLTHLSKSTTPADQDVLYAPGLVALQISLYSTQNRKRQIKSALAKAASYWRHKSKPPITLLQAAGTSLLDSSLPEHQDLARDIFAKLHTSDPSSKLASAGFIASHALTHPTSITDSDIAALPPLAHKINDIDLSTLESAGVPAFKPTSTTATSRKRKALDEKPNPVKKRHRKSRLPKDYDPSKKPDPERWLPARERSGYRLKGKKGKRRAQEEKTQGGISEKEVGKGAEVVKGSEKVGGGGGGGAAQGKTKKKKGKK